MGRYDNKWMLYVHTNLVNGKKYVGITSRDNPEQRWERGDGYKRCPLFYRAIKKYGWNNFRHDILFENLDNAKANELEQMMISILRTQNPNYGYNLTSGGGGTPGYIPSEETRAKLSKARMKENLSEETLRRRSEGLRGRKFSDEHKKKIGLGNSKKIIMLSLDDVVLREFNSLKEAEDELGISHTHISQCCHGHRMTSGGYKWQFAQ